MAQNDGTREVVKDPLASSARDVLPDRSLSITGVRSPNATAGGAGQPAAEMAGAFDSLQGAYAGYIDRKKDDWIAEGKMAYMSGKTEADLVANGNRFTQQGYTQLKVRDDVNRWYMQEAAGIDEAANRMEPAEYQDYIKGRRSELLGGIADPYAQKIAVAAFEQFSPQLVQSQFAKNNEFQRGQRISGFTDILNSTSSTSPSRSVVDPNVPLKLSPSAVLPVMQVTERDRDIGIRTILGEAASQGATGQAAVAHVLRNRAVDGRWPSSIAGVSLQASQFSAWNTGAGGNNLVSKYGPGNPMYEKAGKVFDAVMSGRHVDPTGGATHYYSPSGMTKLVQDGDQKNSIPGWLKAEAARSGGTVKIGGHVFAGKASMPNAGRAAVAAVPDPAQGLTPEQQMKVADDLGLTGAHGNPAVHGPVEAAGGVPDMLTELNKVATEEGVAVTGISEPGASNEIQDLVRGYGGLNPNDKATAISSAMANQLANGDDTLFTDAGGIAMLHELGATPDEVQAVRNAHEKFSKAQLDKYDSENESWRSGILDRASKGTNLETLLGEIDKRVKDKELSDGDAQGLARAAAEKIRIEANKSEGVDGNIDYLSEVGGLYQQIQTGGLDFEGAAAEAKKIGTKYGAKEEEVSSVIGQMFNIDQAKKNSIRTEVAAQAKKFETQQSAKAEVNTAVARGVGLNLLSGDIDTVNGAGQPAKMSKQQYGIQTIKDKYLNEQRQRVEKKEITQAQGDANVIRSTMLELQRQQVVDKETQSQLVGALSGNIITKDGTLSEDAVHAYDAWKMLRDTPEINAGYLAQTVGNDYVRGLLETAYVLDGGNMVGTTALSKAHEIMNDRLRDPNERIAKDAVFQGKLTKGVRDIIDGKSQPGFFEKLNGITANSSEEHRAMSSKQRALTFVQNRAEAIHMNNPQQDGEVSLKLALEDLENSATVIAGNLVLNPDRSLSEDMGLQQFGVDAPDAAVTEYLREYGADIWDKEYSARVESMTSVGFRQSMSNIGAGPFPSAFKPKVQQKQPSVYISYNAANGVMTFDLYKDEAKGVLLGQPRQLQVKDIGKVYYDKTVAKTSWTDMWNNIFHDAGSKTKTYLENQNLMEALPSVPPQ